MKKLFLLLALTAVLSAAPLSAAHASPGENAWEAANARTVAALDRKDLAGARDSAEEAVRIAEEHFGSAHMKTAVAYRRLAELEQLTGDTKSAGATWDRAARSWSAALGPNHPYASDLLTRSAADYAGAGDTAEAILKLQEALKIQKQYFGERHTSVAATLQKLAAVQRKSGDAAGARGSESDAADILAAALEPGHARTLAAFETLARHAFEEGDVAYARAAVQRGVASAASAAHPAIRPLASIRVLGGDLAVDERDVIIAEEFYLKAVELLESLGEDSRSDRLTIWFKLQELYHVWGREDAAAKAADSARQLEAKA